jgi:Ca-activated chloride channel family protein
VKRDRRLYVYPMAAEGPEESLPHIEELYATVDLARAGAKDVRAGMAGVRDGDALVIREHDLVPRADLSVELFDDGLPQARGYQAHHVVDAETLPPTERAEALKRANGEAEYVLVPLDGASDGAPEPLGLDLAIVVDTSAATETAALAVARAATGALLAHLGNNDRAVVWGGDASLRPVVPGRDKLATLDEAARREVLAHLATIERGGATDLGAMLAAAAQSLDPSPTHRGLVVYVGDGAPTVGELALVDLQARLAKLPRPVRVFGLGVGDAADMAILAGLARGAFAERVGDANAAARSALRLLEAAERPARLGASVDLGPTVERVYPRDLGALVSGEAQIVVGRLVGAPPTSFTVKSAAGAATMPLKVSALDDGGDLSRRWANGRLVQMIDEGVGRAAMVDLGTRHGIITPVTSLYVPTKGEMTVEERAELERRRSERRTGRIFHTRARGEKDRDKAAPEKPKEEDEADYELPRFTKNEADNKEGGTGTRAKGEEGSMGNPHTRVAGNHYARPAAGDSVTATVEATPSLPKGGAVAAASPPAVALVPQATATSSPPVNGPAPRQETEVSRADGAKRQRDLQDAAAFGMVGVLAGKAAPASPAVIDAPEEQKPPAGKGDVDGLVMTPPTDGYLADGDRPAQPDTGGYGSGGLGLSGAGEGGGGRGQGIGLGGIGTIGHGAGGPRRPATTPQAEPARLALTKSAMLAQQQRGEAAVITVRLGDLGHAAFRCGGAAMLPFEERIGLWRERLAAVMGNAAAVARVYRIALASCEAPTWRERSRLSAMLLDAMPTVQGKVALWRIMFGDAGAADSLYRGLLARVRTPLELRQLHDALGLQSIDPGVLAKILKEAKTPGERVTKLRGLVYQWPDDFSLALKLLDTLEDAGDDAGARELGRKLRARPDADARVRTAVGELYLRIASRAKEPAQRALDEAEARRAFGEIVEFAPDDPIARRRIGDLLRAHGWYAEAARQYETLARLAPDDASVALLLAAAAEGMGKLEEAVRWTEKGGASGAPDADTGPARTARAFAAMWLAWGRQDALGAGRAEEAKALAARLARLRGAERLSNDALKGTRVTLTWSHPELHPTLWTNALGAPMPAPEGDVTLGIAAATVPVRDASIVEVRLEADEVEHAARLGAEAILTVVFDEDGPGEAIVRARVRFAAAGPAVRRFSLTGSAVKEVRP